MFLTKQQCFVVVLLIILHFKFLRGQDVLFRFAKEDFGIVNESENSFATFTVERIGRLETDVTVIIKVSFGRQKTCCFHAVIYSRELGRLLFLCVIYETIAQLSS